MWPSPLTLSPALHLSMTAPATMVLSMAGAVDVKQEHLVWQPGFGQRFFGTLLIAGAVFAGASRSGLWVHGVARMKQVAFRLEWCVRLVMRRQSPKPKAAEYRAVACQHFGEGSSCADRKRWSYAQQKSSRKCSCTRLLLPFRLLVL
jgi:hypothetical protein